MNQKTKLILQRHQSLILTLESITIYVGKMLCEEFCILGLYLISEINVFKLLNRKWGV